MAQTFPFQSTISFWDLFCSLVDGTDLDLVTSFVRFYWGISNDVVWREGGDRHLLWLQDLCLYNILDQFDCFNLIMAVRRKPHG